eukprot:2510761-Pyramimonas_sp.AAC.1
MRVHTWLSGADKDARGSMRRGTEGAHIACNPCTELTGVREGACGGTQPHMACAELTGVREGACGCIPGMRGADKGARGSMRVHTWHARS